MQKIPSIGRYYIFTVTILYFLFLFCGKYSITTQTLHNTMILMKMEILNHEINIFIISPYRQG